MVRASETLFISRRLTIAAVIVLATVTSLIAPASASASPAAWSQLSPAGYPAARAGATMAYDPATGQTVLFGGASGTALADTWDWNGSTWTQLSPATSPPARSSATMVYDPATGLIILFGGYAGGYLNDTWSWNGSTWTQLSPATSPPARDSATMAYDPAFGQMILFGGYAGGYLNDTWDWNGSTWTQLSPATSPSARAGSPMAYDPASGQMILFSGQLSGYSTPNDTWNWNGSTWTQLSPAVSPPGRFGASTVYDSAINQMVIFGGSISTGLLADTWAWNGTVWTQLSPVISPPGRYVANMAYNLATSQTVLFGGYSTAAAVLGDTWSFQTAPGAPTGVVATRGNTQVTLTWSAPASNGGSPVTGYSVTATNVSTSTSSSDACPVSDTSTTTGCTITGLTNGDSYTFAVAAINAVGTGSFSLASSPVTPATVPGAPTGVVATRGNTQVTLTWSAPASNGGSPVTGYICTLLFGYNNPSRFVRGTTSDSCTFTGLSNDAAYGIQVTAVNAVGSSPVSERFVSSTPLPTSTPTVIHHRPRPERTISCVLIHGTGHRILTGKNPHCPRGYRQI